jgi:Ca2+-binding EF-hand superfamily protein
MFDGFIIALYQLILALYPSRFREEYGVAALDLLRDRLQAEREFAARLRLCLDLLRDTAISLPAEYHREQSAEPHPVPAASPPKFYLSQPETPRRSALVNGAILTFVLFVLQSLYMTSQGKATYVWLMGSHHPSPSHILPAPATAPPADLDSEVKVKPAPYQPPISPYFKLILVLGALDLDQDNVISATEIANSSDALRTLDKNHDGKLDAEECGWQTPPWTGNAALVKRAALAFMRDHPVLAALDTNHDGEISAAEIRNAPKTLWILDRNHDRKITEGELRPDPIDLGASRIMLEWDTNGDGRISSDEARNSEFFTNADRNHDGYITREELAEYMRQGNLTKK